MPGLAEIAATMMLGAERRIDVSAANVSNMSTPGYRAHRIFSETLDSRSAMPVSREVTVRPSASLAMTQTDAPLDFATDASSVLALRGPHGLIFSRSAQLQRDGEGKLVDSQGRALQSVDGGDLVISPGVPKVLGDGTVVVEGQPQGRIGLFDPATLGAGEPELASAGSVKQGMVVGSDVELGDEMLELNKASRMAETGAKLFQLYDDLLAKTASQLGSIAR